MSTGAHPATVRILMADDHRMFREGLGALLAKQPGLEVVGEAEDGRRAVALARRLKPDIAIIDIAMPELNGIDACAQLIAASPTTKVMALTMHSDRQFIARMFRAGARAYVLKDSAFEEIVASIEALRRNKVYVSRALSNEVFEDYLRRVSSSSDGEQRAELTTREREVLQLIAEGGSTRAIAERLGVSVKTVETHRRQIMDKLHIRTVAELTKYAIRQGLTTLE